MKRIPILIVLIAVASLLACNRSAPPRPKRIVLISGDEEYRSEEALPQLAKILSKHHGFKCTVLFAIDSATGEINPDNTHNIPGLEKLPTANLIVVFLRFRDLPDEQMEYIVDYLELGKPVVGLRTATHAFNPPGGQTYSHYADGSREKGSEGGFGRRVLGEKWTLLILRDLTRYGPMRFQQFEEALPGIAPNTLSARLKDLETAGMIERRLYSEHPPRLEYHLTEKGKSFGPVLKALRDWGRKHAPR